MVTSGSAGDEKYDVKEEESKKEIEVPSASVPEEEEKKQGVDGDHQEEGSET